MPGPPPEHPRLRRLKGNPDFYSKLRRRSSVVRRSLLESSRAQLRMKCSAILGSSRSIFSKSLALNSNATTLESATIVADR